MTIVESPPQAPSQDELQALIEEARLRARRRRLAIGGAVVAALAAASTLTVLLWPTSRSEGVGLRKGFHAVQGRGPVQHALLEDMRPRMRTVDLASGRRRPTRLTHEIWWDPRSGLSRTLDRADGVAVADVVQQKCFGTAPQRVCIAPSPFDLPSYGVVSHPDPARARRVGTGSFRGTRVVWVEGLMSPSNGKHPPSGNQTAFDVVTHKPVALRMLVGIPGSRRRRIFFENAVTLLPDLPAKRISFAVPDGGAPLNANLYEGPLESSTAKLEPAAKLLGRPPLWLGRSYRGHRLRVVQTGSVGIENAKGGGAGIAPVAHLDYGAFRIDEYGPTRPLWLLAAPPAGTLLEDPVNRDFTLERDGVLVEVVMTGPAESAPGDMLALARALRPAT
jgi:hypothetical protein